MPPLQSPSLHRQRTQGGLSLLELLVAVSIMAMALGMLYRAGAGSARSASEVTQYQKAALLAQSLLGARDAIEAGGWNESGESAGFTWSVQTSAYSASAPLTALPGIVPGTAPLRPLHELAITVSWQERGQDKHIRLHTLRPERLPVTGGKAP